MGVNSAGGALLPYQDQKIHGNLTVTGTVTSAGGTQTGATLTNATLSGTTTIGAGATLTAPALGAATGTSLVLSGDIQAATYHAGATAGVTAGPFTSITAITVKNGLVTAITGS